MEVKENMPSIGMGLSLTQSLRLEQKLEQRLVLQLTLDQIGELQTESEQDARREHKVLVRIFKDLDRGVYTDVPNFVLRVGKRVPKAKRTEGTRRLVTTLRRAVETIGLETFEDIRVLVSLGIRAHERWGLISSSAYAEMLKIMESPKCESSDLRRLVFEMLAAKAAEEQGTSQLLSFLDDLVECNRVRPELFPTALLCLHQVSERTLVAYQEVLELLPQEATQEQLERAFRVVGAFDRMLGHLHLTRPVKLLEGYVVHGDVTSIPETVPEIIRAVLPIGIDRTSGERLGALFGHKDIRDSIDTQREVLQALLVLRRQNRGAEFCAHLLEHATSPKIFARIMREVASRAVYQEAQLDYPIEATSGEEILRRFVNRDLYAVLEKLGLEPGYAERFLDSFVTLPPLVPRIILRLAEIYSARSPETLPVLARITEAVVDGRFKPWRYGHHAAAKQLAPIAGHELWAENVSAHRVLGKADLASAQLRAVKLLQTEAAAIFAATFNKEWRPELGSLLETEIARIENQMRLPDMLPGEKRELGQAAKQARTLYKAARLIELFDLTPSQIDFVRRVWTEAKEQPWAAAFGDVIDRGRAILDSPELKSVTCVEISETDDLLDLLRTGEVPVLSCQRWTGATGYNKCLLAYVADPNKKMWQMRARGGEVIGRVVVRLLPFKKSALILVEPPYANQWSDDHTRVLLAEILGKAARLAEAIGKVIAVGFIGVRRWGEWGQAFEELGKQFGFKPKTTNFRTRLPESFNPWEYSDSLGGCIARGSKLDRVSRLTYIGIGTGAEGEPEDADEDVEE